MERAFYYAIFNEVRFYVTVEAEKERVRSKD
jgi:hypothetical protein